jgi:hypothetical protein
LWFDAINTPAFGVYYIHFYKKMPQNTGVRQKNDQKHGVLTPKAQKTTIF